MNYFTVMLHLDNNYIADLQNPLWKKKREEILKRDGYKCVNCGCTEHLHINHTQYHFFKTLKHKKEPWDYPSKYLITLCQRCHEEGHKLYKIPMKYV